MRDEDRGRPHTLLADAYPAAVLLNVEALGLAAVAAGLAASIAEGLPRTGTAILGFEGVTVAFVMTQLSRPAAVVVLAATGAAWFWAHRRAGGIRQIRRPVSCQ